MFLKFPNTLLGDRDTIIKAWLWLHKVDGPAGAAEVRTVPCMWDRNSATYTNTMDLNSMSTSQKCNDPHGGAIPDGTDQMFNLTLKGDVLQSNRVQGNHFCLEVSGGPVTTEDVISSEFATDTTWRPTLKMRVRIGTVPPTPAPMTQAENEALTKQEAQMTQVENEKRTILEASIGGTMLAQKRVLQPNATMSEGDIVARDAQVEDKLKLEMAEYRANAAVLGSRRRTTTPSSSGTAQGAPGTQELGDARHRQRVAPLTGGYWRHSQESGAVSLDSFKGTDATDHWKEDSSATASWL